MVVRTARSNDAIDRLNFGEISIVVGRNFVVSVRHGQASPLSDVRTEVEQRPDLVREGPSAVVHAIVDRVVSDYEPVMDRLEANVRDLEREVFSQSRQPLDQLTGPTCQSWVVPERATCTTSWPASSTPT